MQEIEFFRDAFVEAGRQIQSLWTMNITVLLAAMGWSITSRSWPRGLSAPVCIFATTALSAFFSYNLYSMNTFYLRANAASDQLLQAWDRADVQGDIRSIFSGFSHMVTTIGGDGVGALVFMLAAECVLAIVVGVLLSNLWRRTAV